MARTTISEFPFVSGQNEGIDARVLPDGLLTRAKNVRLRKDGRFGVRPDFDPLGTDTSNSADWLPYDLISGDAALLSIGDGRRISGDTAPWDVASYTGTAPFDWHATTQTGTEGRTGLVTNLRAIQTTVGPSSIADCAAAGGIVCLVAAEMHPAGNVFARIQFIRASSGEVILSDTSQFLITNPRVVVSGTTFFIMLQNTNTTNQIYLRKFDPTTDSSLVSLTTFTSARAAINCYDIVTRASGSGFWLAVNSTGGGGDSTEIYDYSSSGVLGSLITGPAVAYDAISIRETASRVHIVTVTAGGVPTELRSYTLAGALSTGPTDLGLTAVVRQPGITDATFSGTERVGVYAEQAGTPNSIYWARFTAVGHTLSSAYTWGDGHLASKPITSGTPNYHHLFAGTQPDGSFYSSFLAAGDVDVSNNTRVYAYTNKFAAGETGDSSHLPQIARDSSTGKFYWTSLTMDGDGVAKPSLVEFDWLQSSRRQTARMGDLLYIASTVVQIYDGTLFDAGFFERPRILAATPTAGSGSLPSSTDLLVALTWEFRDTHGNFYTSDVSDVETVTMGVGDDTISLTVTAPHGIKGFVTVVAWRSIEGINQLRRAESAVVSSSGGAALITLELSDAVVRENAIIYTQGSRGALSGMVPHEAPQPADFIWKFGDRLLTATADSAQVSKSIFPGESVNWSGAVGFSIPKIAERITGVAALDQRGILFTADRIYAFAGEGPNDLGEGRFSEPIALPSSTGLTDWRSLVETPLGIFFQGSNGQIWVLPRDSGAPVWIGQPVRDTLVAFPVVTSATLVTEEQLVSFTCNNAGATDGRIVSYDLRAQAWIVDEFASAFPLTAAASYLQRLVVISGGVVYTEKTSLTPNTYIEHGVVTGDLCPFQGIGWGKHCETHMVGEYRGDCDLRLRLSYDSGKTWTTHSKQHQIRASAGYSVGDIVRVSWDPPRRKIERVRQEFLAVSAGSATEGFVFNKWGVTLLGDVRGPARLPAAQRG